MREHIKPRLLIFYDHFYPAYKAGGPIQSLTNLSLALQDSYDISIVTSAYDLNDNRLPDNMETNVWSEVILPQSSTVVKVWYAGIAEPGLATIKKITREADPSIVYLNGMFSFRYVLLPLFALKKKKIIICPRGMLQPGALAGKSLKKRFYLSALRMTGFINNVAWHATSQDEQNDVYREFGKHSKIFIAGNIPRKPVMKFKMAEKKPGELRLVYLSLISEKKNLLQAISIVANLTENISLDIYGPVKDEVYWQKCKNAIDNSGGKIVYKGNVKPELVQDVFSKYDAFILLTKGENFGHALYECLSAGRPVIGSYFTPWNHLTEKNAGWNVDIANENEIAILLNQLCSMDQSSYQSFCIGAYKMANEYYENGFDTSSYKKMFS